MSNVIGYNVDSAKHTIGKEVQNVVRATYGVPALTQSVSFIEYYRENHGTVKVLDGKNIKTINLKRPRGVVFATIFEDGTFNFGWAMCNRNDVYDKFKGFDLAAQRYMTCRYEFNIWDQEAIEDIVERLPTRMLDTFNSVCQRAAELHSRFTQNGTFKSQNKVIEVREVSEFELDSTNPETFMHHNTENAKRWNKNAKSPTKMNHPIHT